jgi:hypothetical protein
MFMVRLVLATPPAWLKNAIVLATGSLLLWDMLVFYMAGQLWVLAVGGDRLLDCKISHNTKAEGYLLARIRTKSICVHCARIRQNSVSDLDQIDI